MNVVADGQELVSCRVTGVESSFNPVFRNLCLLGSDVIVVCQSSAGAS